MKTTPFTLRPLTLRPLFSRLFTIHYSLFTLFFCLSSPAAQIEVPEERVGSAEITPETETAIRRGLAFIKYSQNDDGSWGPTYKIAQTSLAIMAFIVEGNTPEEKEYGETIDKAISYLLARARRHGGYFADETSQVLYQHSYAVLALAEVWGQSRRPDVGPALKKAVDILLRAQGSEGGWRYDPKPGGHDISCTTAAVQALASAKEAGIHVPEKAIARAIRCTRSYQSERTGHFGYGAGGDGVSTLYQAGAGPLSLYMLGDRESAALRRGLAVLIKQPETNFTGGGNYLAHYYCIQACYQAGDTYFNYWYPRVRRKLLDSQQADGSWSATSGGPAFSTSLSVLILAVPYRYLPIYQR